MDKGHGLVILHESDLAQIYQIWLDENATRVPGYYYFNAINHLRDLLAEQDSDLQTLQDDRAPTMYFKVKVHKPNFRTKEVTSPGLFEIKNTIAELANSSDHTTPQCLD